VSGGRGGGECFNRGCPSSQQDGVCYVGRREGLPSPIQTNREEPEGRWDPGGKGHQAASLGYA